MKIYNGALDFQGVYMFRPEYIQKIKALHEIHPIVALLGPRQCGKTTLAHMLADTDTIPTHFFDLEDPEDLVKLDNPKLALENLSGLIVIDEIQRSPELFPYLRVLVDKNPGLKLLILGSASRELIKQSSESLAGRVAYIEVTPFSFTETKEMQNLWIRGGFPRCYLAPSLDASIAWRKHYITTFLEQDIPNLGINVPPQMLRRFWMMLAHFHGNVFNAADLGKSLGVTGPTIRRYLDILTGTFMVRQLQPWFVNMKKRQVKSPKIYFKDSGILHTLVGISDQDTLLSHPRLGASWEGFALEEIIRYIDATPEECYFWATHAGAELDLLIIKDGKKLGFEFKYSDAPKLTASMKIAFEELELDSLTVIYPGKSTFPLHKGINVSGLENYLT